MSKYTLQLNYFSHISNVFSVFFVAVNSRCSGYNSPISLSQKSGIILSPLYPKSYSDNEKCTWTLNSPFTHTNYLLVYDVIDIHVSHKRLDGQMKCTGHLHLYDGMMNILLFLTSFLIHVSLLYLHIHHIIDNSLYSSYSRGSGRQGDKVTRRPFPTY